MAIIDIFVFAGGVFLGVYFHDFIVKTYQGADAFAKSMEAKAAALKAAVTPAK